MAISAALVKELREKTGAGMMDCKKILEKAEGNMDKAIEMLREKGLASADKKADRIAAEGVVESYIHGGGRIGVLIEINCETDFVAKTDGFKAFVRELAMQVAAMNPQFVRREEVPEEFVQSEREILRKQALDEGKPANIVDKMVEGRLSKRFKEVCLLEQPYIKDGDKTIDELVREQVAKLGENINVRRFVRFELGEGIEKKEENFADEVMSQVKK
ncbi:translation elongation factor Ts [Mechercharimyces sp. CAU 1602]|uniref:translation elongation factor Ts n=1 Tax=Mechercharimyces sp. CAU 1602 TaxID=2973933 RepID=UPI002161208F|nr:translation elongation factor Ts [Mechercharimyces sp. CAU 1602]MCS1351303.1 translation elongation factor Ts [Mechercharimyces sp. CAU 1602]